MQLKFDFSDFCSDEKIMSNLLIDKIKIVRQNTILRDKSHFKTYKKMSQIALRIWVWKRGEIVGDIREK